MPRITIEILKGRTLEQKRALAKAVCESVSECFDVPQSYVKVRIVEEDHDNFARNGELICDISAREGKTAYGSALEPRLFVTYLEGRTLDQVRALVEQLSKKICEIIEVEGRNSMIFMCEMKKDEMAEGGVLWCDR